MRKFSAGHLLFAFAVAFGGDAAAQSFPTKQIHFIVPFTPGSATDILARTLGERIGARTGQTVIVENKPGAGGTIGAGIVAKAEPDGYTVLVHSSAHTVNPAIYDKLPYDTLVDFAGVTPIASLPNVLVIAPSKGIKSVAELVAYGKSKPGVLNYGSAGVGSATHMNAEKFRARAGFDAVHIPYKGTPEALNDTVIGRVDYFFAPLVAALAPVKDGRLLALAVGSATRSPLLPEVPTTVEAGVADSDYAFWVGMMAPGKTPRDIVNRLNQLAVEALASPELKERLTTLGATPMPMTPEQFDAHIKAELPVIGQIARAAGVKAN